MSTNTASNGQEGPKAPDASKVLEHLRAATLEMVAAGRAFLDMLEQAVADMLEAMGPRPEGPSQPRVERIDVEDGREGKSS